MKKLSSVWVYPAVGLLAMATCLNMTRAGAAVGLGGILAFMGFGSVAVSVGALPEFARNLVPVLLYQAVFGGYLYRHFCTASVYYFSRCAKKAAWFLKESGKLYLYGLVYEMVYFSSGIFIVAVTAGARAGIDEILFFLITIWIYSMFLFLTTLMVNLIAIAVNSVAGFGIVAGAELFFSTLFAVWEDWIDFNLYEVSEMTAQIWAIKCNPISHLVLTWHSSVIPGIETWINDMGISFDLISSAGVFTIAAFAVLLAGIFMVRHIQILGTGKEE